MEALKSELEDSLDTTAAVQELRNKREHEVVQLKKAYEDEAKHHEQAVTEVKHRYTAQVEAVNEQLDQAKRVSGLHDANRVKYWNNANSPTQ